MLARDHPVVPCPMLVHATFSITARCGRSGAFGIAVATRVPAVGAGVPYLRAGVGAIATQARTNPYLGIDGLELLAQGSSTEEVLAALVAWDPAIEERQFAIVDARGTVAAHTGSETHGYAGHRLGEGVIVAGNLLTGPTVLEAMMASYEGAVAAPRTGPPSGTRTGPRSGSPDAPRAWPRTDLLAVAAEAEHGAAELALAERLLGALEAGQAAGGDRRGKQSAAVRVVGAEAYPFLDLRVDEHTEPIPELRRVYGVWREVMLPHLAARPTRAGLQAQGAEPMGRLPPPTQRGGPDV